MNIRQYISILLVAIFLILSGTALSGQIPTHNPGEISKTDTLKKTNFRRNSVYAELLGHGIFYSVNYDYRISDKVSLRAGLSFWSINTIDLIFIQTNGIKFRSFPLMVNYLIGKRSSRIELGAGIMPVFFSRGSGSYFYLLKDSESSRTTIFPIIATVGYRYQPLKGGFVFRAGITPAFGAGGSYVTIGLSLGYAF